MHGRPAKPLRREPEEVRAGRCPKCTGNLYYESDVVERLLLRKCLQCGLIESYFWLEQSTRRLIYLPVEYDQPLDTR
jgi:hypothetical protein